MATVLKVTYRSQDTLTVTALNGAIVSSPTWIAGWTSGTIDNTTNVDVDLLVSAVVVVESAAVVAGEIRVYAYTMLNESAWPDVFSAGTEGTEGTATIHDVNILASHFRLLWSTANDTTASQAYTMPQTSLASAFGGVLPPKCALFITHSTSAALETAGNAVYTKGIYYTST